MKSFGCALVVAAWVPGALALSEEPPPAPTPTQEALASTVHRHLGLFLRLDAGPSYTYASEPYQGTTRSLSGGGGSFGFSIGGALGENNILALHISTSTAFSLSYANSGNTASGSVFFLGGLGPEYTHYFMPANLYISVSLLLTTATLTNSTIFSQGGNSSTTVSTSNSTDVGLGPKIALGKEWWVSDHWGLGLALHYSISWNQDTSGILGSGTLTTNVFSINFSATYN